MAAQTDESAEAVKELRDAIRDFKDDCADDPDCKSIIKLLDQADKLAAGYGKEESSESPDEEKSEVAGEYKPDKTPTNLKEASQEVRRQFGKARRAQASSQK